MEELNSIADLKGMLRRRKKGFILTFLIGLVAAVVVAFLLPPVYLSQSTILIENQQIPQDYVKSTITSLVEERLQTIKQQVTSRERLTGIIKRFNLYSDLTDRHTAEEILDKMRENITLKTISADVQDKKTNRASSATVAFTLSYEGKDPAVVQKVANVLASLYLEENLKARERQTSNTTTFLEQELDELRKQIDRYQNRIAEFKGAHYSELPEFSAANLQTVARLSRDLEQADMQIRALSERKILLQSQLANVDPQLLMTYRDRNTPLTPEEQLGYLRLQLATLRGGLTEDHPDIIRLKQSIRELGNQVEEPNYYADKVKELNDLKNQMAGLETRLKPEHPDVIRLKEKILALSKEVENLELTRPKTPQLEQAPRNPAYVNLKTQVETTNLEINSLVEEKKKIQQNINLYQKKLEAGPLVEKEYTSLARDYENAKTKYNEIMNKLMEARVSQGMEEGQRGERFTIIEAAELPEKPNKPNRLAIVLIGFMLALGAGVGFAALRETVDVSVKTVGELMRLTGAPVLSVIPVMETDQERRSRIATKAAVAFSGMVALALCLYLVHVYVMPLEILWVKLQKKWMMTI
jgi:polysaccharide biosynthesis transport protein